MSTLAPALNGTTFAISDVGTHQHPMNTYQYVTVVEDYIGGKVEACSNSLGKKLTTHQYHGFMETIEKAFDWHYPLVLSPDHVWLLLCQGFSHHINENAETLRKKFVQHEGQALIKVVRNDFVRGKSTNPWEEVFPEFCDQLKEHIGGAADLLNPTFTTTGVVERAACQITLMESMKAYFKYELHTKCGIPSITLEGTVEDWVSVRNRVEQFREYDLDWWVDPLYPVLDQFAEAASGTADQKWWQSFYKMHSGSGGDTIDGHVLNLIPYVMTEERVAKGNGGYRYDKRLIRNQHLGKNSVSSKNAYWGKVSTSNFPSGLANVPFVWEYFEDRLNYEFLAGFVGTYQDSDFNVRPEIGWAVREVPV